MRILLPSSLKPPCLKRKEEKCFAFLNFGGRTARCLKKRAYMLHRDVPESPGPSGNEASTGRCASQSELSSVQYLYTYGIADNSVSARQEHDSIQTKPPGASCPDVSSFWFDIACTCMQSWCKGRYFIANMQEKAG